jgi:hypothetical protein
MAVNPWMNEQVVARRSAEMERVASELRMARQALASKHAAKPGPVARRTGRILMAMGWRLAGPDALPMGLEHRLAGGQSHA